MTRSPRPRISQRVRDEAALICAIAASRDVVDSDCNCVHCSRDLDAAGGAWGLADFAIGAARKASGGRYDGAETNALAEALLRCGWSPGDEL